MYVDSSQNGYQKGDDIIVLIRYMMVLFPLGMVPQLNGCLRANLPPIPSTRPEE